jgi:hypothetical protein
MQARTYGSSNICFPFDGGLHVVCLSQAGTWRAQSHTQLSGEKKISQTSSNG